MNITSCRADDAPLRARRRVAQLALLAALATGAATEDAHAVDVTVTGEFRPSTLTPDETDFVNTTPKDQFCSWRPQACAARGIYMFSLGGGQLWTKSGGSSGDPQRDTVYIQFPSARTITLRDATTGLHFDAVISFVALSATLRFGRGKDPLYYGVGGGCSAVRGAGGLGFSIGGWALRDNADNAVCYTDVTRGSRTYDYHDVGLGLNVELPAAVSLSDGHYTAQASWSVGGQGSDLDLGDNITGDPILTLNFAFDVAHDFQVVFPTATSQVHLMPTGGWQSWTDYGKVPLRLQQQVPFQLTSSGEFSMRLRCEHQAGGQCGIRNPATQTVAPLEVTASLPAMRSKGAALPARDVPVIAEHSGQQSPRFVPRYYSPARPSSLEFAVVGDAVKTMLDEGATTWQGDVTVIFDAHP